MKQQNRNLQNKKVLVAGLGRSGTAAARLAEACGAQVTVTDIRSEGELKEGLSLISPQTEVILGSFPEESLEDTDLVVVSPGIPPGQPWQDTAERLGTEIIGEVEFAYRLMSGRILGITGTNGKTSTTVLTGRILAAAGIDTEIAGNVGTALSDRVLAARKANRSPLYVTELSSFQLEATRNLRCPVAVILNCTPDHFDRYRDFGEYRNAKFRIFHNQKSDDHAVINADSPVLMKEAEKMDLRLFPFSITRTLSEGIFVDQGALWARRKGELTRLLNVSEIGLRGSHNLENTAAALAASFLAGADSSAMSSAVRNFKGVEHRLEMVGSFKGVEFYNDSKSTTPHSTQKALDSFSGNVILIMGGFDKGSDFTFLRSAVSEKVRTLILIGQTAEKIGGQLAGSAPQKIAETLDSAVAEALGSARPGDTVLLSPACSSFDMFKDFEHRGSTFKKLILDNFSAFSEAAEGRKRT